MYKFIKKKYNLDFARETKSVSSLELLNSKIIDNVYNIEAKIMEAGIYEIEDQLDDSYLKIFKSIFSEPMLTLKSFTISFFVKHDDIIVKDNKLLLPTDKIYLYKSKTDNFLKLYKYDSGWSIDDIMTSTEYSKQLLEHSQGQEIYNAIKYNDISYSFGPDYDCNEYYLNEIGFDYEEI